jgi:hypothetical protein
MEDATYHSKTHNDGNTYYNLSLRFERVNTSRTRIVYSVDMVFTNPVVARKINKIYDRLFIK